MALALLSFSLTWADSKTKIPFKKLPVEAQTFVKKTFPNNDVLLVEEKYEYTHDKKEYKVELEGDIDIKFDKMGVWKEIDCDRSILPLSVIPKEIQKFITSTYPNDKAVKIERDLYGYEVKLTNGKELVFNENGEFIRFDD